MSNVLRYDSLLVHYLAAELDERLRGRRLEGLALDPGRRIAVLDFEGESLSWNLHPAGGWITPGRAEVAPEPVPLARRTRVGAVRSPRDERVLIIELRGATRTPGRPTRLVIELLGNQWNLIAIGPDDRIVAALWRRRAGGRELRPGQSYAPTPAAGRRGAERPLGLEEWRALLHDVAPEERARVLVGAVAYLSPLNVAAILGTAGAGGAHGAGDARDAAEASTPEAAARLDAAHARYLNLASLPPAAPRVLELAGGPQPYPLPLPGVDAVPCPTLLAAMAEVAAVAGGLPTSAAPTAIPLELLEKVRERVRRLERRRERLAAELEGAASAAQRDRRQADLLMGQLHLVRKGMTEVALSDWEGGTVTVALDPALAPVENAEQLYERARREARAAERVPELLARLDRERAELGRLLERAERGEPVLEELLAAAPASAAEGRAGAGRAAAPPLPYRRYQTSGGLEVRVGRSSRANDDLTFRHSSPNDIWLHARDAAGAHVILRWGDPEANPPARDLTEAATLAALHSRARSSGLVAVDWTRRKYVRKPRKSGPGLVAFERGRTIFVEPDAEVEKRLRRGE
jgi:predicted ribosome quality control (RQC) complex YloA/Tae2 family protein